MHLKDVVEILYLGMMLRWERTGPPDGHLGELDGEPRRNSQMARLARVLKLVASGDESCVFNHLAARTQRRDGPSYVSRERPRMNEPVDLLDGWYLEGCTSLEQKREILEALRELELSSDFVAAAFEFVAGRSVQGFMPTGDEQNEIVRLHEQRLIAKGAKIERKDGKTRIEWPEILLTD